MEKNALLWLSPSLANIAGLIPHTVILKAAPSVVKEKIYYVNLNEN